MPLKENPKVERNPALNEIESKLNAKKMEFKQLQENERILKSQLEQTQHDIIKTQGAFKALADLKTFLLGETTPKLPTPPITPKVLEKKPLSKKDKENIKKNLAKITPEAKKIVKDFAQGTMKSKKKK